MLNYESLHNHTTISDGRQTYAEVLATGEANGFGVMAFTDHDILPSPADLQKLREYQGPVKWLLGCEISSGLPKELGGGPASMFHILGLFTDPTYQPLLDHSKLALAARSERMERIVANLDNLGFKISIDDCLNASGGESVGRPHIVKALGSHIENDVVMGRLQDEMKAAAVLSADTAISYMRMIERDPSDYPYRLFLSDDAFIPGVYVDYLYSIDMDASVKLIRDSGGVAILAHWPTIKNKIRADMLEGFLKDGRLDGVEVRSGFFDGEVQRQGDQLSEMAERTGQIATYGIDGHRVEDVERFARDTALSTLTVGQTARLIERIKPNLSFSNI